jgi:asparagine synthetase B (glutamine-hydrolysing)
MGLSAMRDGTTALRGVRRLCPGDALLVDSTGTHVKRVDRLAAREPGIACSHADRFLDELGAALRSDARDGNGRRALSFSGGMDSAALACAWLRSEKEARALSFVAEALDPRAEIVGIDSMAGAWPRLQVTRVDASAATAFPEPEPELRDDPPMTPLALLPARRLLWSSAQERGVETVIEGEGGDELFAMLPTPLDAIRGGRLAQAARHLFRSPGRRTLLEYGVWLPLLPGSARPAWLARRHTADVHLPAFAAWATGQNPLVREATDEYLATLVHRPFADRLRDWLAAPMVVGAWQSRRQQAATFGLQLDWPLLHRNVLELVLGLHEAGAIFGGSHKPFLRSTLEGAVPDGVRLAPKDIGLYRALVPRILTSPLARQAVRDERVRSRLADLVRFERIEAMLDGLAAGRALGDGALWQLECVVSFAEWYARASREYGVA